MRWTAEATHKQARMRRIANSLLIDYTQRRWYGPAASAPQQQWMAYKSWIQAWIDYCNKVKRGEHVDKISDRRLGGDTVDNARAKGV